MKKQELKELYNRYKILLWPVCSSLASITILALVIIPQLLSYLQVRGQISSLQSRVTSLEVKAQELQMIDGQKVTSQFQSAFTVLPVDPEVPSALVVLQNIAQQSGVEIKNTTFAAGTKSTAGNNFILNITVSGSISAIRSFLTNLPNAPRIFQVEAITAKFIKNSVLEVEIPVSVYYDPLTTVKWSVEDSVPKINDKDEQFLSSLAQAIAASRQMQYEEEASYSAIPMGKLNLFD